MNSQLNNLKVDLYRNYLIKQKAFFFQTFAKDNFIKTFLRLAFMLTLKNDTHIILCYCEKKT